jgi:hypothetical protein
MSFLFLQFRVHVPISNITFYLRVLKLSVRYLLPVRVLKLGYHFADECANTGRNQELRR